MKTVKGITILLTIILSAVILSSFSHKTPDHSAPSDSKSYYNIIPKPAEFIFTNKGDFVLNSEVVILKNEALEPDIIYLNNLIKDLTNLDLELVKKPKKKNYISLGINTNFKENFHHISCNPNHISIEGGSSDAVFNGIQSIRQVLSINTSDSSLPMISSFELKDEPNFKWRGMLLDVCRHYFQKDVVKKYIDLMAFYKLNVLHWHLTEDQAWRIAIDAYPNLTEVGAWRTEPTGQKYGGFYTKEDIKEIVKYASERHVQIVPEIEMPGHSSAAVASYPFLGCSGDQIPVPTDWGVFKDIYCPTEDTFLFLETVLGEVMELFPSNYVHIGGDEAPKSRWEESEFCQNLMKTEGLHDYEELQSYFINRMATFLEKNGKTIIGWDEILNDQLTESAIIQSWRGMDGGKKAVAEGRNAIMSPTSHCYLDYSLKAIDTEKLYHFNPIPENCTPEESIRILGAECNMWTEHVPTEDVLDSKVFPRLIAASEAFWSKEKDYSDFLNRLDFHYTYLDKRGVHYGEESVPIHIESASDSSAVEFTLSSKLRNIDILYKIRPYQRKFWQEYNSPITIDKPGKQTLIIQASKRDKIYGDVERIQLHLHSFMNVTPNYSVPYSDYYTAGGESGLTDGILGSLDFRDGHWQGFFGDDVELTLRNPNQDSTISEVSLNFYRYINSWIFPPESVSLSISNDGENFTPVSEFKFEDKEQFVRGKSLLSAKFQSLNLTAAYIKISLSNIGTVPMWHEAAGEPAWIFVDEIIVN